MNAGLITIGCTIATDTFSRFLSGMPSKRMNKEFAKSAFGNIFNAFMSRDPKQMKAAWSNIRSDLKGYGLKGIIKDTFGKEVVDGFKSKIGTYFGDTENINKYNEAVEALKNDFEAYQQAAFAYKQLVESENEKTDEELKEAKERFLAAKQATEESFEAAGIEGIDTIEGPTAVVIGYDDYVAPAKAVNDYAKDHEFYTIKAGIMDGKVIDVAEVKKLASLPSKETLYSMLASALLGNIRNLAVVLDQAREKQENAQ